MENNYIVLIVLTVVLVIFKLGKYNTNTIIMHNT